MSIPAYPEYKDSGVQWLGKVPSSWSSVPFGMLFRRIKRTDHGDEELLSVYRDYGVIRKSDRDDNFNNASDDLSSYQLVEPGDLAMNKMKAWQGSLGVSDLRGIVSPAYFVFSPRKQYHPPFMHYLLRSPPYAAGYMTISKGIRINQWDVDPDHLTSLPVLFPSIAEQQAIATFLDRETAKIDALVEEQERLIALLKEKRQAVISHAVTKGLDPDAPMKDSGIEWLGEIPAHWEAKPLRYVIDFIESGTSVNATDEPAKSHELGVLKTSCVYTGDFRPNENKTVVEDELERVSCPVRVNSLIVSRMNTPELVGAAGYVSAECSGIYLPDRLWQVQLTDADPEYAHFWTQSRAYRGQVEVACAGTSSSMQNLSQDQFRGFLCAFPPSDEQKQIVSHLRTLLDQQARLLAEAHQAIILLKERRAALISAAVTGKIDVRGLVEQHEVEAA